jgi:hypothetical protein
MVTLRDQRAANAAFYARNRAGEIVRGCARQDANLTLLRELRRVLCADCAGTFEPFQMDFDHRDPAAKSFRLTSPTALGSSRDRLLAEVAKGEVVCAVCHRIRTRAQHQERTRNRQAIGTSRGLEQRRRRWTLHARMLDDLRRVRCADCGERFPPCAMDFDHREATDKRVGVTRMVGRACIKRILAEAAMCDIVCANCHRARTFRRRTSASRAGVAQLVERRPSKPNVAGSNPVSRSNFLSLG